MSAELPPCTAVVTLNEKRHGELGWSCVRGLCAELERVQAERDSLRAAISQAREDLRAGRSDAALVALEGSVTNDLSGER